MRKDRDLANVGPFNYTQTFADKKAEPRFSMGAKLDSSLVSKNAGFGPAPVAYEPDIKPTKTKAPAYRFGSGERKASYDIRKAKLVPPPGAYEVKSKNFNTENPKFYMGQRISFDDTKKFIHSLPGPGSHDASPRVTHRAAPVFSMGARLQTLRNSSAIVPGPGNYVNNAEKLRTTSPSFGFGSSKRPEIGGS